MKRCRFLITNQKTCFRRKMQYVSGLVYFAGDIRKISFTDKYIVIGRLTSTIRVKSRRIDDIETISFVQ